jgi:hypothetical protein
MIPYPSTSEPIPDIYAEIKNDESKFAVLSAPLGGVGDGGLMSDPTVLYHQIHHEKPIYGGHESRVSLETTKKTQTYFLSMFHIFGSKDDVIKQDLATHGLSLFNHFDIKYVTLHKSSPTLESWQKDLLQVFLSETKQIMSEILSGNNPVYEDDRIVVYKIPKPNSSEPFLLLGSGWHVFVPEQHLRTTMKNSEILIVNPTNSEMHVTLNVVLHSIDKENTMTVSMNNEELSRVNIPTTFKNVEVDLLLKPGVNVVTLDTNKFSLVEYGLEGTEIGQGQKTTISLNVQSISIVN